MLLKAGSLGTYSPMQDPLAVPLLIMFCIITFIGKIIAVKIADKGVKLWMVEGEEGGASFNMTMVNQQQRARENDAKMQWKANVKDVKKMLKLLTGIEYTEDQVDMCLKNLGVIDESGNLVEYSAEGLSYDESV